MVNTCYANRASGTTTLYSIVWDLDAHRAEERWKTKDGRLKWKLIRDFLTTSYPDLAKYIFAAVRSTSGKGIALALAISPMELVESTQRAQNAARALQHKVLHLLNHSGLGADPGALGLKRDFPNWHDDKRALYLNRMLLSAVQASYERKPVVTDLLQYLKQFPFLSYQRKRGRQDLLYHDLRAEPKLAKLYRYALDNWHAHGNSASGNLSTREIRSITGLSQPFLLKFLATPQHAWLDSVWLNKRDGWNLTIKLDVLLTLRATELIEGVSKHSSDTKSFRGPLKRPDEVQDGERNEWLTQAILLLKHEGVPEQKARDSIMLHIESIPGREFSRNCRNVEQILRSIYRHMANLFGIKPGCAPTWLLASTKPKAPPIPLRINTAAQYQTFLKKGPLGPFTRPALPLARSVSFDGCVSFRGNFYSLFERFLGAKVYVFEWGEHLRILDSSGRCICVHKIRSPGCRGSHMILDEHRRTLSSGDARYLGDLVERLDSYGVQIGSFARNLVAVRGVYAVRRLWALAGLVKTHGAFKVNTACLGTKVFSKVLFNLGAQRRMYGS